MVERLPWPWLMGTRFPEEELGRGVVLGVCVVGRGVVVVVESREAGRWEVGTGTAISGAYICGGSVGVIGRAGVDLGAYHWRSRGKVWNEESGYLDVGMLRLYAAMSKSCVSAISTHAINKKILFAQKIC